MLFVSLLERSIIIQFNTHLYDCQLLIVTIFIVIVISHAYFLIKFFISFVSGKLNRIMYFNQKRRREGYEPHSHRR